METKQTNLNRRAFLRRTATLSAFMILPRYVLGGKGYTAPSDRINIGFIGTGKQAFGLQRQFLQLPDARVIAAADVYKHKLDEFAKRAKAYYTEKSVQQDCAVYNDFGALLDNRDVNAVVIATPDHWHAIQAVMAAKAGKDIYCEKPLSLTIKEGRAMVDATRKYDRVFQTGSMQRSWPEFRQAVELVRNGYIGELKTIKVSVGPPPKPYDLPEQAIPEGLDWKSWLGPNEFVHFNSALTPSLKDSFWAKWRDYKEFGGGFMTDWGAHMFDIAQWALDMDGSGPVEVIPPDGKDYPDLTYRYANGLTMTHRDNGRKNVEFIGTEGTVDVQRGKLVTTPESLKDKKITDTDKRVYFSDNHYRDWTDAIRKRSRPICDVEVGHRTATVCTIGNIAYELGRPLKWDPEKEIFTNDREANAMLGRKMQRKWAKQLG
ncbi:Gfo/Idh/MocA family protein [Chitinophaga sp. XS-30]|uniref:Gfo/Idh/MocA family protein n=1 Tax=Chitinophaga sp. XS-30 TaxID=2604421 RepID=UPI0011DD248A|nr:Gfo/Idh/MocA family oxidoreductase [Chitinophaga sp. XS-30]QEH41232.1 Gfo/Idh/MocA family oxidoreductase [Chitinophaga sp. XS-30]